MKNVELILMLFIFFSCNQKHEENKHEVVTDSVKHSTAITKKDSLAVQSFNELDSLLAAYFHINNHDRKIIVNDSSYKKTEWNKDVYAVYDYYGFLLYEYKDEQAARKGFTELENCWKCLYADDGKKQLSDNPKCKKCWDERYFSKGGVTYLVYKNIILQRLRRCSEDIFKESAHAEGLYESVNGKKSAGHTIMLSSECGWVKGIRK